MLRGKYRLFQAILLVGLAVALAPGCSKYDGLERNMQYVSDGLLRKDAEVAWRQVNEAHAAWIKAGSSHDKDNAEFVVYQDAYGRYAVIYNELFDRQNKPFGGRLGKETDTLPPPPPGVSVPEAAPKAAPAVPVNAPAGRELNDAARPAPAAMAPVSAVSRPAVETSPAPAPASKTVRAAATRAAGPGTYLIQPGDTLSSIAKRHGISEKRLMDANNLTDARKIAAGKPLTIPAP
ncbi:LysM peptidoglycan-binding domain-containing protein [Desulfovibrio sp. TomC]|uniref:LysM peptidoglycan-binding domain-containing protein n=1 Tax=Desulfovibrio sp. TomC TaxID=1562888 RepID=UPI000575E061|nr:LysM domain-containing protein [Desulfovibrio sp. TomC]KHK00785.1 Membrane-bound lytic murein transglycosylase D precursor [Desulfovibrio sp. TomC]